MTQNKSFLKALIAALTLVGVVFGLTFWNFNRLPDFGGDFQLTYRAQPFQFSTEAKPLNLIYFGYAKCPDVCPMTLAFAGAAFKKLSAKELAQVRLLFVSVDQAHDDPTAVADYATNFFPDFLGLSGSQEQIDAAIKLFPATYMMEVNPKSYLGYSIIHTDKIFFLNKRGKVIDEVPSPRDADVVLEKIKEHL